MPVQMKFTSPAGTFDFSDAAYEMPTIERRLDYKRKSPDGISVVRSIAVTLSGFFEGADHNEVVTKYQALAAVLKASDVKFSYNDGASQILDDQIVQLDSVNEPDGWKQYTGDFKISFHYFETISAASYHGISASYTSPLGTHTFSPAPLWSSKTMDTKQSPDGIEVTPSGVVLGRKVHVSLEGDIVAADHAALVSAINAMRSILSRNGTLNYGSWSNGVFVVSGPDFGPVLPTIECPYKLTLGYYTTAVFEFRSVRTFNRTHLMPKIRERPNCLTDSVKLHRASPQEVTYELFAKGYTISTMRSLLASEADNLITGGGVEVPGGTEKWDDQAPSVHVTIKKWYQTPIVTNIEDTN